MSGENVISLEGEKVIKDLIAFLRLHTTTLPGTSMHQEAYKNDVFRLFAAAYNAGLMNQSPEPSRFLRADALRIIIVERAEDVADSDKLATILDFWREWTYAWDHNQLRR